tara:strand:- start:1455 stop:1793 length:339 start_codon:yes stop_codon:yes gene_type:complete
MTSIGSVSGAGASPPTQAQGSATSPEGGETLPSTTATEGKNHHIQNTDIGHSHNMSCKDFISLHNSAIEPISKTAEGLNMDMEKLIELIIAMKLLEEIVSGDIGSSSFSTVA